MLNFGLIKNLLELYEIIEKPHNSNYVIIKT
jgi:hypothetical protein